MTIASFAFNDRLTNCQHSLILHAHPCPIFDPLCQLSALLPTALHVAPYKEFGFLFLIVLRLFGRLPSLPLNYDQFAFCSRDDIDTCSSFSLPIQRLLHQFDFIRSSLISRDSKSSDKLCASLPIYLHDLPSHVTLTTSSAAIVSLK
jgi:hypothetical protein